MNAMKNLSIRLALVLTSLHTAMAGAQTPQAEANKQELRTLLTAFHILQESLARPAGGGDLLTNAIRGIIRNLDPDGGDYFTEQEVSAMQSRTRPGQGGIGSEVRSRNGELFLAPIRGAGGEAAGVQPGDRLVSVEGNSTVGMSSGQAGRLLSGPLKSMVRFSVMRAGSPAPIEISMERHTVVLPDPTLTRPTSDIAVLSIPVSQVETLADVATLLKQEWRKAPYRKIIVDIRGNQGGLVKTSIGLAAMFMPSGELIARSVGNDPSANRE